MASRDRPFSISRLAAGAPVSRRKTSTTNLTKLKYFRHMTGNRSDSIASALIVALVVRAKEQP